MTLAVVTGATRGNGRAAAIELASQGAEVVLVGREPGRVDAVAREASDAGDRRRGESPLRSPRRRGRRPTRRCRVRSRAACHRCPGRARSSCHHQPVQRDVWAEELRGASSATTLAAERIRWRARAGPVSAAETQEACSDQSRGPPTDERKASGLFMRRKPHMTFSWQYFTRPLAPTQDVTVLRGAGRGCGRRAQAGRFRPAPRQARRPTRWRLARSVGEGHQSPGRGPGKG